MRRGTLPETAESPGLLISATPPTSSAIANLFKAAASRNPLKSQGTDGSSRDAKGPLDIFIEPLSNPRAHCGWAKRLMHLCSWKSQRYRRERTVVSGKLLKLGGTNGYERKLESRLKAFREQEKGRNWTMIGP
jgi:hypothetical protein